VSASATDSEYPTNTLPYVSRPPPRCMTINTNTGAISWTPTEAQGPSTNTVAVRVTDNGSPGLSDTKSFTVIANEVNSAPVLTVPIGRTTCGSLTINVTVAASVSLVHD